MTQQPLTEAVLRSTMTAMVTVIMGRNDATRSQVEAYSMEWDGQTLTGVEAAEDVLVQSLTENSDAWIEYLAQVENYKVVVSMDFALTPDLAERVKASPQGRLVLDALADLLSEAPAQMPEIIDIRSRKSVNA